ncbi:serine aminopeptidase domain-containing protein [Planctomycetota bacterium]
MKLSRREFLVTSGMVISQSAFRDPQVIVTGPEQDVRSLARRTKYLEEMKKILPYAHPWEQWLERTGELPPDFESMPSNPFLPNPLVVKGLEGGRPVLNRSAWDDQRNWMRAQLEYWVFGKMPPPPRNLRAKILDSRQEGDVTVQDIRLEFGPEHKGTLRLQILIPPGQGPFPAFVTTHSRRRPWVNVALRRGYIGCISYAADTIYVDRDDSEKWVELYPDYDFARISRWAWGLMRAVDYLFTLPIVDHKHIATSGHSRNSKLSILAAAFDDRFTAVIPSRGNTLDTIPARYCTGMFANETLEAITRHNWFHPRLRFFVGREHKLPVDTHMLLALVAPRGLLISHAYTEGQANPWGIEQAYRPVREVYRFLGAEDKLGLYQQPGTHPSSPEDFERYLDFVDTAFGRNQYPRFEKFVNGYTFEKWQQESTVHIDVKEFPIREIGDFLSRGSNRPIGSLEQWDTKVEEIRKGIKWILGDRPPGVPFPCREVFWGPAHLRGRTSEGYLGVMLRRPSSREGTRSSTISFGDDLTARLYYPRRPRREQKTAEISERSQSETGRTGSSSPAFFDSHSRMPAIIWLHQHSYAVGYSRNEQWIFDQLVEQGFVVATFDQIGFGSRVEQVMRFYRRYPTWSLLGKMVEDTRAAIDMLAALEFVDASRIYLLGSSLGAKIGLFTAALDERVAGVAAVCGFAPLRLDSAAKGTEGMRHYSHLHGLLPRLGFFVGNENRLPVDYDEILAAIAPRPLHIVAPTLDRYAPVDDVVKAVEAARQCYALFDRENALTIDTPLGFHGLVDEWNRQKKLVEWVGKRARGSKVFESTGQPKPP